ncbi:MAG: hypothetical protein C0594_07830, partial [Marinilabiliales bacterium]
MQTPDEKWYLIRIQPYRHSDRSIHGVVITQVEITNLKNAVKSNMILSTAVEQSANSIMITNLQGEIEYVNSSFCKTSGYAAEEIIGKKPSFMNSGTHPKAFFKKMWNTILKGNNWRGEVCNIDKKGNIFWFSTSISAIKDENEIITGLVAISKDITSKKEAEKALYESEEKYRRFFETLTQGVVYQDGNGKIISANKAAEDILGMTLEQMLGITS